MFSLGQAVGYLLLDTSGFQSGISKAFAQINTLGSETATTAQKFSALGSGLSTIGTSLTKNVTLPIVGIGAMAVKLGMDFDQGMSKVKASAGATEEEFAMLREEAIRLGGQTKFSSTEAADAMYYMAQAGWKANDMMDGMSGVMDAAAASGEDLGLVANIIADGLGAFGLEADQATRFADILATTATATNTDIGMLGESFKYVGAVAGAMKFSLEDTSLALGLMANGGIKASQSGTTLRAALTNMVKPSEAMQVAMDRLGISITNEDGSMKSLKEVMDMLRTQMALGSEEALKARVETTLGTETYGKYQEAIKSVGLEEANAQLAMKMGAELSKELYLADAKKIVQKEYGKEVAKGLTDAQIRENAAAILGRQAVDGLTEAEQAKYAAQIFGKEAMSGMLTVINTSTDKYNELSGSINKSAGSAQTMSKILMDNLAGDIETFTGGLESAAVKISDKLTPALRDVVKWLTSLVDKFSNMSSEQLTTIMRIAGVVAAIGPLLLIFGKLSSGLGSIIGLFTTTIPAIGGMSGVLAALTGPIGIVIAAIALLAVAWSTNLGGIREKTAQIFGAVKELFAAIWAKIKGIWDNNLMGIRSVAEAAWTNIGNVISVAMNLIRDVIKVITNVIKGDWGAVWKSLVDLVKNLFNGIVTFLKGLVTGFFNIGKSLFTSLWDGIKSIWTSISNWVQDKVQWLLDKINPGNWFRQEDYNANTVGSHAAGLDYVPYDNYVANLHEGERVLTRQEARDYNGGGSQNGGVTNNFYSPQALDPISARREMEYANRLRDLALDIS